MATVAGCIVLSFASGFVGGWKLKPGPEPYPTQRARFVLRLAEQFGHADTLVIGDSLTEETLFDGACGRTFAAGVGGARPRDLAAIAPALVAATTPRLIVLEAGTNHYTAGAETTAMAADYPTLAQQLRRYAPVLLVGMALSREGKATPRSAAPPLPCTYPMSVAPVRGAGLIAADGVHNTAAGSRAYRRQVAAACHGARAASGRAP